MASIRPYRNGWRVQIKNRHGRDSGTFRTKKEAARWALEREAELSGGKLPEKSLADALRKYAEDVTPTKRGARWEGIRLAKWQEWPMARMRVADITGAEVAAWRDDRAKDVAPGTVRREMVLLRSVFEACREWRWIHANPMNEVRKPTAPASRKRRITDDEVQRIALACGLDRDRADTALNRTGLAFLFALETAMRAGEITGMKWPDVAEKSVTLPRTKNGDVRQVPLSKRAREILAALPRGEGPVFGLEPGTRDTMFRRARDAARIANLRFHDSRAEAIWRLSKKLDVLELARVIGHRDIRSLMIYYQADADELADRL